MRRVLAELPTRADREPVVGAGEGGDETTAIDQAAERAVLARFEHVDGVTFVSEEVGQVGDGDVRIVIDPIDGSLNAKRGIGFFSLSVAVAAPFARANSRRPLTELWLSAVARNRSNG